MGHEPSRPTYIRNAREYPPEQIEWYLNNSNLGYAILTNGKLWRLIPRNLNYDQPRFQTYLEFNLPAFLKEWDEVPRLLQTHDDPLFNDFLTFYLFFSLSAFQEKEGIPTLIERARKGSSEYRLGIGNDIKTRVFEALRISIEGFIEYKLNKLNTVQHLEVCREQSFILLYRLLFIMYAEDRTLLPYRINRLYTENRSLGRLRRDIEQKIDRIQLHLETDYSDETTEIWDEMESLFDLINTGKKTYAIPAYNGGLFNPESNPFLAEKELSDRYISRVIDQLSRARDEGHPHAGLFRVDYRDLQIQHLGNIYESLLELHPHAVIEPVVVIREKSSFVEKVIKIRDAVPRGYEKNRYIVQTWQYPPPY